MKKILTVIIFSLFASACMPMDSMHENMQSSMQCECCKGMMSNDNKNSDMSQCCCKGMMDSKNYSGKMCSKKQSSQSSLKAISKAKKTGLKSSKPAEINPHHY